MENQKQYALVLINLLKNKGEINMFNKEEFKRLNEEREKGDVYNDWELHDIWVKITDYICQDEKTLNEFIDYMKTEMTGYEYGMLSEISDDISITMPSREFVEAYKALANKYPKETEDYKVAFFIKEAERLVKSCLKDQKHKNR